MIEITTKLRACPEAGPAPSGYEEYLQTDLLLSLQKDRSVAANPDELVFQIVHQSSELWLKFVGAEIADATACLERGDVHGASRHLRRAASGFERVIDHVHMLEQVSPIDYLDIRAVLGNGAGFDSPGFRRLHELAPHLWAAFRALVESRGATLLDLYVHRTARPELHDLAEQLVEWDAQMMRWRLSHLCLVERMLGEQAVGTQRTPVAVLRKRVALKYFGALWDVRAQLARERETPATPAV